MTQAQIDLMCADCSITVYPKHDEPKTNAKGRRQPEFREIPQEELDEVNARWAQRLKELKRKKNRKD